jgi:alpha-1,2-mannosyltransferase
VNGGGPDIFGTEPYYFYFSNLFLNFNVVFLLALISFPLLVISYNYRLSIMYQKEVLKWLG